MEAIKMSGYSHGGILTLKVPENLDEQELEVIILSVRNKKEDVYKEDQQGSQHEEKVKKLTNTVGKARYPDFPINKYDVYNQ